MLDLVVKFLMHVIIMQKRQTMILKNFIGLFSHLQCLEVNLSKLLIFPDYI